MASLTQWTWVWMDSGSWWWTGRHGVLRFMGSQRVRHDWVTELNWGQFHFLDKHKPDEFCSLLFLLSSYLGYRYNACSQKKYFDWKNKSFTLIMEEVWTSKNRIVLTSLQADFLPSEPPGKLDWVAIPFSMGSSDPGIKPESPAFHANSLPSEPPGKLHGIK